MKRLILEASQNKILLGLSDRNILLSSHFLEGRSSGLLPALEHFCDLKKISSICVGTGPGSYMGTRTTATIGKTLSYALDIPLIEFPSPLAYLPIEENIYTIIGDAKMNQLYIMQIEARKEKIKILTKPSLIPSQSFPIDPETVAVDLRSPRTPNLDWVCRYTHEEYMKGNILTAKAFTLSYLR